MNNMIFHRQMFETEKRTADRKEVRAGLINCSRKGVRSFSIFYLRRVERFSPENDGDRDLMDVTLRHCNAICIPVRPARLLLAIFD